MAAIYRKALKPGLYAITDSDLLPEHTLLPAVASALRGGAVLVQYRDKRSAAVTRLQQARDLVSLCREAGVPLIINDDPALAKRVGADGVHLGQSDGSLAAARQLLGESAILGATCHGDLRLAESACRDGADYLAFGRFHGSSTKPKAPDADQSILAEAHRFERPLTAIGGITLDNGAELIRAGADMLAVIGGLFGHGADQTEQLARGFTRLFEAHHPLFQATPDTPDTLTRNLEP